MDLLSKAVKIADGESLAFNIGRLKELRDELHNVIGELDDNAEDIEDISTYLDDLKKGYNYIDHTTDMLFKNLMIASNG